MSVRHVVKIASVTDTATTLYTGCRHWFLWSRQNSDQTSSVVWCRDVDNSKGARSTTRSK